MDASSKSAAAPTMVAPWAALVPASAQQDNAVVLQEVSAMDANSKETAAPTMVAPWVALFLASAQQENAVVLQEVSAMDANSKSAAAPKMVTPRTVVKERPANAPLSKTVAAVTVTVEAQVPSAALQPASAQQENAVVLQRVSARDAISMSDVAHKMMPQPEASIVSALQVGATALPPTAVVLQTASVRDARSKLRRLARRTASAEPNACVLPSRTVEIAPVPLKPAAPRTAVTKSPPNALQSKSEVHDSRLCYELSRPALLHYKCV